MKLFLTSYYSGGPVEYRPGEIVDFNDADAAFLLQVGGARDLTDAERAALPEDPKPAKTKAKG